MRSSNSYPSIRMDGRRSFLTRLGALAAAVGMVPVARAHAAAGDAPAPDLADDNTLRSMPADDPWMARLRGSKRVVFHSHMPTDALALRWAEVFLNTQAGTYGVAEGDCGVVVGLNGSSIGWLFNDRMWSRYPVVGQTMNAVGSANPYTALAGSLVSRGVILLACQNSLRLAGSRFLSQTERASEAARNAFYEEARSNLLPGVEVVPSMVVTLQQAQDRGCRYVYAGG